MSSGARAASKRDKKTTLHRRSWRRAPGGASRVHAAGSTTFTKIANKWNTALIGAESVFDIELELFVGAALASHGRDATASVPRRPHDVF